MNFKKAMALLIGLALFATLFVGCSTDNEEDTTTSEETQTETEETATTDDTSQDEEVQDTAEEAPSEDMSNMQMVQVLSVDGTTITAIVGETSEPDMEEMGEVPEDGEMPEGDGEAPADGEMGEGGGDMAEGEAPESDGEMPEGDGEAPAEGEEPTGDGEAPADGEMGEGGQGGGGMQGGGSMSMSEFVAGDETITFEISDSTVITIQSAEGTEETTADAITDSLILQVMLDDSNTATNIIIMNTTEVEEAEE